MLFISLSAHLAIAAAIVYIPNNMIGNDVASPDDSIVWGYVAEGRKQSNISSQAAKQHPEPASEPGVAADQIVQNVQDDTPEESSSQNEVSDLKITPEPSDDNVPANNKGCHSPDNCDAVNKSKGDNINTVYDKLALAEYLRKEIEKLKFYPDIARLRGMEGTVFINFYIGQDGITSGIAVVKSSGSRILDEAAVKTVGMIRKLTGLHKDLRELDVVVPITYRLE